MFSARTASWRWLASWLRPYWKSALLVELCILAESIYPTALPLGLKRVLEAATTDRAAARFGLILAALAGIFLLSAAGSVGREHFTATLTAAAMRDVRTRLHDALLRLPAGFYVAHSAGDLLARLSGDAGVIEQAIADPLPRGAHQATLIVIGLPVLCLLDFRLALATLLILPCAVLGPRLLRDRALDASQRQRASEGEVIALAQEHVGGHAVLRAFGLEPRARADFQQRLGRLASQTYGARFLPRLVSQTSDMGGMFGMFLILAFGGWLLWVGAISVASLVAFGALLVIVTSTTAGVASMAGDLLRASGSIRRVAELLATPAVVADMPGCTDLSGFERTLAFEHVSFGYGPDQLVLVDVTFSIPAGSRVALVGRSGAGKSTLLSLLLRFYDPSTGAITIDGQDLRSLSQASVRSHMSVVFQDNFLFDGSLRHNIALGGGKLAPGDVERAATAAQLDELVASWPESYDTPVGERGQRLSGGQRQRVALARALVRQPALLLLDEPTTSLDPATEAELQRTLEDATSGCTVIVATHRLLDMERYDHILVLDSGRLREQGTHRQLLDEGGVYSALWRQQHRALEISEAGLSATVGPEHLRGIDVFAQLPDAALEKAAQLFHSDRLPAGRTVYEAGDQPQALYLVAHGSVELLGIDGQSRLLEEGDAFGGEGLECGSPRDHAAVARTPTLLLVLGSDQLLPLLAEFRTSPRAGAQLP